MDCSIVIPLYAKYGSLNAEAIRSAISQKTSLSYEIVLVGGLEEEKIFMSLKDRPANISFCFCENPTAGAKRNVGLLHSDGDFITFLDCDDLIDLAFVQTMVKTAIRFDADITFCNFTRDETQKGWAGEPLISPLKGDSMVAAFFTRYSSLEATICIPALDSSCMKLFRSSLLKDNGILFEEGYIRAEDSLFVNNCLVRTSTAVVCQNYFGYFWRHNPISSMNNTWFYATTNDYVVKLHKIYVDKPAEWSDRLSLFCGSLFAGCINFILRKNWNVKETRAALLSVLPPDELFFADVLRFCKESSSIKMRLLFQLLRLKCYWFVATVLCFCRFVRI